MNVPINGLSVQTTQLLSILPRGKRFGADDVRPLARRLGMSYGTARQRIGSLVKAGRVGEVVLRDGRERVIGTEWEVRS